MNIYLEIFGYIGTIILFISMMMNSLDKLRIVNIIGSLISMTYAIFTVAYPVVLLNLGMIAINITKLIKEKRTTE